MATVDKITKPIKSITELIRRLVASKRLTKVSFGRWRGIRSATSCAPGRTITQSSSGRVTDPATRCATSTI